MADATDAAAAIAFDCDAAVEMGAGFTANHAPMPASTTAPIPATSSLPRLFDNFDPVAVCPHADGVFAPRMIVVLGSAATGAPISGGAILPRGSGFDILV